MKPLLSHCHCRVHLLPNVFVLPDHVGELLFVVGRRGGRRLLARVNTAAAAAVIRVNRVRGWLLGSVAHRFLDTWHTARLDVRIDRWFGRGG